MSQFNNWDNLSINDNDNNDTFIVNVHSVYNEINQASEEKSLVVSLKIVFLCYKEYADGEEKFLPVIDGELCFHFL